MHTLIWLWLMAQTWQGYACTPITILLVLVCSWHKAKTGQGHSYKLVGPGICSISGRDMYIHTSMFMAHSKNWAGMCIRFFRFFLNKLASPSLLAFIVHL